MDDDEDDEGEVRIEVKFENAKEGDTRKREKNVERDMEKK